MAVLLLIGISMDLVRAENQYRSQNSRHQRMQPNLTDADYPSYYYECVWMSIKI